MTVSSKWFFIRKVFVMPVRKIPKNHLSVTGSFASRKNGKMGGFESILEKEYLLLLDFDDEVESFEEQPINIPITGIARGYTPDVLVHFRADSETGQTRPPLLTEIKHSSDLKRNAEKYAPKFAAAEQYVAERGWEFRTTTEKEIRTPRLANLKFLREYRKRASHSIGGRDGQKSSLKRLLKGIAANDDEKLYWLPVIWNLILTRRLITNLDVAFDDDIFIHLPEDAP